jgi:hypothetical protein
VSIPQVQVVVAGEIVVQLDAVLEGLHCCVGEAQRRVILFAEVGGLIASGLGVVGSRHDGDLDVLRRVGLIGVDVQCKLKY